MKMANIKDVKDRLSAFVEAESRGEEVVICHRNVPVARLVAVASPPPTCPGRTFVSFVGFVVLPLR